MKNKEIEVLEKYLNGLTSYPFQHKDKEYILSYIEQLENRYDKALEILSDYNMPCEYKKRIIPDEYCEENCEVSDEVYKKCWNKYIELTLKGDSE